MTDLQLVDRPARLRPTLWPEHQGELAAALLLQAQWDGGLRYHREARVAGTGADATALLPDGAEIRLDQQEHDGDRTVVAAWPGLLARVVLRRRVAYLTVVGAELAAVDRLIEHLGAAARTAGGRRWPPATPIGRRPRCARSAASGRAGAGRTTSAPERPVTLAELFAIREQRLGSPAGDRDVGGYL